MARIATVEINLLEASTGKCIMQANLSVEKYIDGELPTLVLKEISSA